MTIEMHVHQNMEAINAASFAGRAKYAQRVATIGDAGAAGFATVHIPVDGRHKSLIRDLADNGIGKFDAWHCDWRISPHDFDVAEHVQSLEVQEAACNAYAAKLREAGFMPSVRSVLD